MLFYTGDKAFSLAGTASLTQIKSLIMLDIEFRESVCFRFQCLKNFYFFLLCFGKMSLFLLSPLNQRSTFCFSFS
jgi:hypothetical protein